MFTEMEEAFNKRTRKHINIVRKYLTRLHKAGYISEEVMVEEFNHDEGKYKDPERTPYLHVNWKYKMRAQGVEYNPPREILDQMAEATFHHIKSHKHHPEYWDDNWTLDKDTHKPDRDAPAAEMVDATKMPLIYIASMMADWLAMSEEKQTSLHEWIEKNVNIRWKFTHDQVVLIDMIANDKALRS